MDNPVDRAAKSIFTLLIAVIFLDIALQALISLVDRYLPELILLGIGIAAVSAAATALKYWPRYPAKPVLPPNTALLGGQKARRSRSTGSHM